MRSQMQQLSTDLPDPLYTEVKTLPVLTSTPKADINSVGRALPLAAPVSLLPQLQLLSNTYSYGLAYICCSSGRLYISVT